MLDRLEHYLSGKILQFLERPTVRYAPFFAPDPSVVRAALQPGDILLVEGNTRLAAIIKFLTQSTWSHAALYVGERPGDHAADGEPNVLLEADADIGVATAPLSKYLHFHTRICRPIGLSAEEKQRVIDYTLARIGKQYDSKQIVDLARYLFPYPPVPVWFRRRMLAIGAGDPTKAICSTLIAEAFQSIHYPILPERVTIGARPMGSRPMCKASSTMSASTACSRRAISTSRRSSPSSSRRLWPVSIFTALPGLRRDRHWREWRRRPNESA